jgi:hypothetical protein
VVAAEPDERRIQKGMHDFGRIMRDNLRCEGRLGIESEGVTPHTAFFVGDGLHIRPLRICLMTVAALEHLEAFWPAFVGFEVHDVIKFYLGDIT